MTDFDRRAIIKTGVAAIVATLISPGVILLQKLAEGSQGPSASHKTRWGMVIDTNLCNENCTACTDACRKENNVPLFGDSRYDGHWIRKVTLTPKSDPEGIKKSIPMLCNHCEHPPCQHVCPVAATFTRGDGLVLIDKHRCIGCRYCMVACPYNARTFVFKKTDDWTNKNVPKRSKGVVEKCNFCVHLLDQGKLPACVEACTRDGDKGMIFGNLADKESTISKYIRKNAPARLRADLGLEPKVYYKGM